MTGGRRQSGFSRALAAFAFLAMAVRAIVPAGYMLAAAPTETGLVTVTLCSVHGAVQVQVDTETGAIIDPAQNNQPAPEQDTGDNPPCVFATAAALAAPETAPLPLAAAYGAEPAVAATVEVAPGRGLAAPPPWSTGPPLTA